jgi:hypothetical protein
MMGGGGMLGSCTDGNARACGEDVLKQKIGAL